MMSDYFEHYHRCETLAEFNFYFGDDTEEDIDNDDNYIYCYCSRVFIRDGVKTYYVEKEDASESDVEVLRDSQSQDWEDHSHVHFSLDTSYKVKCERDEGASCYCSASHTDNCCSTDEHDPIHTHGTVSHALQPSDSGADLTYQDYHSETHDKLERMDQDDSENNENYMTEDTWEKFWAVNGERLIWGSWIKKYSDYINPAYLDDNNGLVMDENNIPKQHSVDQIYKKQTDPSLKPIDEEMRERKFSYDSKVNPYKKTNQNINQNQTEKVEKHNEQNKDDVWMPIARRRSCSEHDRILSPWTVTGTDSMTNVTKLTISSYDVTSSHVTSESTPTDTDYSVSSSSSDDPSNDQTRIANIDEKYDSIEQAPEETDMEQYWQFLWKKHFGEQYALHFANYTEQHSIKEKELPEINIEVIPEQTKPEEKLEIECENSEGNSQETPTVIEIQNQVDEITLEENSNVKKRNKKKNSKKYMTSVGVLLQTLLKEEQAKFVDKPEDAGDSVDNTETNSTQDSKTNEVDRTIAGNVQQTCNRSNLNSLSCDDGDDEPPEETPTKLKRSHEIDEDDEDIAYAKIKSTISLLGFYAQQENLPKGELIYRKRPARLRPPRYKRFTGKKTYFDDDGNAYTEQTKDSADEREIQTDDDCTEVKSDTERTDEVPLDLKTQSQLYNFASLEEDNKLAEAAAVPLPCDAEDSDDEQRTEEPESIVSQPVESTKRKKRSKKNIKLEEEEASAMPAELRDDPKMYKYWKKRYSLFHRYDEGIKLDRESWFSVTPERVARHIAHKYAYDAVLDAFCGAGGNTIQFAHTCKKVIAVDIDPIKIEMAKHNATVYGVADRITFIVGDFFKLAPELKADMVFLSPPWGGPNYTNNLNYDLETMMPWPATELMRVARTISPTISLFLPRNSRLDQILTLAKNVGGSVEVEQSFLDRKFVAITAYYY